MGSSCIGPPVKFLFWCKFSKVGCFTYAIKCLAIYMRVSHEKYLFNLLKSVDPCVHTCLLMCFDTYGLMCCLFTKRIMYACVYLFEMCLDTRQSGSVFKILHTRQSEIIVEFPRKNSSNPSLNCRSLFRNVKRFQL